MFDYLRREVGDAVSPATLREFCRGSRDMLAWLERHGVPFEGSLCPDKTSYPTNRHYLSGLSLADCVFSGGAPGGMPRPPCRCRLRAGRRQPGMSSGSQDRCGPAVRSR
jgi:hypothetical protein